MSVMGGQSVFQGNAKKQLCITLISLDRRMCLSVLMNFDQRLLELW